MTRAERIRLEALGARVRAARQARGLSIEAVAARTLIGTGTLSYLERGEREVGVLKLWSVAEALDVSVDQLLDRASQLRSKPEKTAASGGAAWTCSRS